MRGNFGYMQNETVLEVAEQAARKVHRKFGGKYMDIEDLVQEAHIALSTKADLQQSIASEQWGFLQHGLEQDLTDRLDKEVRRHSKNISYNARQESLGDSKAVATRRFSDLGESGFRGGSEPIEHEVTVRRTGA